MIEKLSVALAIFAKTPSSSKVKTRLAAESNQAAVDELYRASIVCTTKLAQQLVALGWDVSWAIAEADQLENHFWRDTKLPVAYSGDGSLGNRLATTYTKLLEQAPIALIIGSDSPQLAADSLLRLVELAANGLAVGPADDGGFYAFAGSKSVAATIWNSVTYSTATTLTQLRAAMGEQELVVSSEPLADFDDIASLGKVVEQMPAKPNEAQQRFIQLATSFKLGFRATL